MDAYEAILKNVGRFVELSEEERAYFVDSNGQEHTIAFAIGDRWISDFYSHP